MSIVLLFGQKQDTTRVDSTQKEVPEAILELVKQYDKAVKEARVQHRKQYVEPPKLEIDGIIIDETMSKSGREFYEIFFANWSKPVGYSNYYLKIKERPFQFNNTVIEVYLKEQLIYQQMMRRRYDEVEQMAKSAVYTAHQHIYKEIRAKRAILEQQRRYKTNQIKSN